MKGIIRRLRPSPAMVVACIALTFAMTGAGYAAGMLGPNTVGTAQLKKNAVISSKVKNNTIVGADVKESSLAKVPSAAHADAANTATSANTATTATNATNATTAANANTVGGNTVRKFGVAVAPGAPAATVLDLGGLIVTLTCPGGAIALRANNNSGEGAQFRFDVHGSTAGEFNNGFANFTAATNANLNNNENLGSGSSHYIRANGGVVTASYGWRNDNLQGLGVACRVFGEAIG
jgi:hypothetical protein